MSLPASVYTRDWSSCSYEAPRSPQPRQLRLLQLVLITTAVQYSTLMRANSAELYQRIRAFTSTNTSTHYSVPGIRAFIFHSRTGRRHTWRHCCGRTGPTARLRRHFYLSCASQRQNADHGIKIRGWERQTRLFLENDAVFQALFELDNKKHRQ